MQLLEFWRPMKYYNSRLGTIDEYSIIEVSNTGMIRYSLSKTPIKVSLTASIYPTITLFNNGKGRRFFMHVIMASSFLDVPQKPGMVVDHINRNILDYSLFNLRFVSPSTNNKNREHPKNVNSLLIVDDNLNLLEEIRNYTKRDKRRLFNKYSKNKNATLLTLSPELLERFIVEGKSLLKELYSSKIKWVRVNNLFELSEFGVLRKALAHGYFFTYGSKNKSGYYRVVLDGKNYLVHTLMALNFLNNNKKLKPGLVIDHIDTNPSNNRLDNLRIVSQSENMSNPITKSKRSIRIGCLNLITNEYVYFKSQASCAEILGVSKAWICKCLSKNIQAVSYLSSFIIIRNNLDKFRLITNINELIS